MPDDFPLYYQVLPIKTARRSLILLSLTFFTGFLIGGLVTLDEYMSHDDLRLAVIGIAITLAFLVLAVYYAIKLARRTHAPSLKLDTRKLIADLIYSSREVDLAKIRSLEILGAGSSRRMGIGIVNSPPIFIPLANIHPPLEVLLLSDYVSSSQQNSCSGKVLGRTVPARLSVPWLMFSVVFLLSAIHLALTFGSPADRVSRNIYAGAASFDLLRVDSPLRIITAGLLHKNFSHLLSNSLAILVLGYILEGVLGRWRTLYILTLTSCIAVTASAIAGFSPVSMGISGGAFGLIGVYLGLNVFFRDSLPCTLYLSTRNFILAFVIVALQSVGQNDIDHIAHLSGVAAGMIYVAFLNRNFLEGERKEIPIWTKITIGVAVTWSIAHAYYSFYSFESDKLSNYTKLVLSSSENLGEINNVIWLNTHAVHGNANKFHCANESVLRLAKSKNPDMVDTAIKACLANGAYEEAIALRYGLFRSKQNTDTLTSLLREEIANADHIKNTFTLKFDSVPGEKRLEVLSIKKAISEPAQLHLVGIYKNCIRAFLVLSWPNSTKFTIEDSRKFDFEWKIYATLNSPPHEEGPQIWWPKPICI